MTKTNGNNLLLILGVALAVAVVSSVVTASVTGNVIRNPFNPVASTIRATSCDGDTICEVAKTISTKRGSTSSLILKSDNRLVVIEGDLKMDYLDLSSNLIKTKESSNADLMLASDTGIVTVDASLIVTGLSNPLGHATESVGYVCLGADGKLLKKLTPCL